MEKLIKHCYYTHKTNVYPGLYHFDGLDMVCQNIIKNDGFPFIVESKNIVVEDWQIEKTANFTEV